STGGDSPTVHGGRGTPRPYASARSRRGRGTPRPYDSARARRGRGTPSPLRFGRGCDWLGKRVAGVPVLEPGPEGGLGAHVAAGGQREHVAVVQEGAVGLHRV